MYPDKKQVALDEIMTKECRRPGDETSTQVIVMGNEKHKVASLIREGSACL